jgi:hypothetical protein
MAAADRKWNYPSLASPPRFKDDPNFKAPFIHRGLVPSKNLFRRDFAINGGFVRTSFVCF